MENTTADAALAKECYQSAEFGQFQTTVSASPEKQQQDMI